MMKVQPWTAFDALWRCNGAGWFDILHGQATYITKIHLHMVQVTSGAPTP